MWKAKALLAYVGIAALGSIAMDRWYMPKLHSEILQVEAEKLVVANQLTTARIIQENLHHVRDLVFQNMEVRGYVDSLGVETSLFHFLTESVQDLKLTLIGVKPIPPRIEGRLTTFPYEVEVEGDFFKFGELCSKFENSRRIISLKDFEVDLVNASENIDERLKSKNQPVKIKMTLEAYWVK
jgi:Tfp pilus assembly protein PilO